MKTTLKAYSVQVMSRHDAFTGKVLNRYFTVEYRRVYATSEGDAINKTGVIGSFGAIGRVARIRGVRHV